MTDHRSRPGADAGAGRNVDYGVREARLKSEFAGLYPDIAPGVWMPAALVAGRVFTRLMRELGPGFDPAYRVLDETHFDFRDQGAASEADRSELRTRLSDR